MYIAVRVDAMSRRGHRKMGDCSPTDIVDNNEATIRIRILSNIPPMSNISPNTYPKVPRGIVMFGAPDPSKDDTLGFADIARKYVEEGGVG